MDVYHGSPTLTVADVPGMGGGAGNGDCSMQLWSKMLKVMFSNGWTRVYLTIISRGIFFTIHNCSRTSGCFLLTCTLMDFSSVHLHTASSEQWKGMGCTV